MSFVCSLFLLYTKPIRRGTYAMLHCWRRVCNTLPTSMTTTDGLTNEMIVSPLLTTHLSHVLQPVAVSHQRCTSPWYKLTIHSTSRLCVHGAFTCSHGAKLARYAHEESFLHVNGSFSAMHMRVLIIRYGSSCLLRLSNMLTLVHRPAVSVAIFEAGYLSLLWRYVI